MNDDQHKVEVRIEMVVHLLDETRLVQLARAENELDDYTDEDLADPALALQSLLEPMQLLERLQQLGIAEFKSSIIGAFASDEDPPEPTPDFAALFPLCACSSESCTKCSGFQLTPRTALALWVTTQILGDYARIDTEELGDAPIQPGSSLMILTDYPSVTWTQRAEWRRKATQSFRNLAMDIASGNEPLPRCTAEEMALHMVLRNVDAFNELDLEKEAALLPAHIDDMGLPVPPAS